LRIIDLAAFYAAIANEGMRPSPHAIESIEQNGKVIYRNTTAPVEIGGGDPANFYQLKTMLQGVVARGTARSIGHLSPYVAGKTGTTDDANDGWFVGFTNDVTVATWVGYDNADEQHRTLGDGETGARVACRSSNLSSRRSGRTMRRALRLRRHRHARKNNSPTCRSI
jgi:penicillin-binding protein 1A